MKILDIKEGLAFLSDDGSAKPVNTDGFGDVVMVVWPDEGEPWVEREPFAGREKDDEAIAKAEAVIKGVEDELKKPPSLDDAKRDKLKEIESSRKAAEDEGVVVNGVRYSGSPGNRQALREALEYAEAAAIEAFPSWKSSDDEFIKDHPVADVYDAYRNIGARRSELIAQEGDLTDQVKFASDLGALEEIAWPPSS